MEDINKRISLRCFFCASDQLELPYADYQPQHGDLIRCANCGRENDFSSLMQVAEDDAKDYVVAEIKKQLQKSFGNSKVFKIKF